MEVVTSASIIGLTDIAEIREGKLRGLWLPRSGSATLYTKSGLVVAADSVIAGAHLILANSNNTQVMVIPMISLQRDYNSPEPFDLDPETYDGIDLSRSSIMLNTSASGYNAAHAIELVFSYEKKVC